MLGPVTRKAQRGDQEYAAWSGTALELESCVGLGCTQLEVLTLLYRSKNDTSPQAASADRQAPMVSTSSKVGPRLWVPLHPDWRTCSVPHTLAWQRKGVGGTEAFASGLSER